MTTSHPRRASGASVLVGVLAAVCLTASWTALAAAAATASIDGPHQAPRAPQGPQARQVQQDAQEPPVERPRDDRSRDDRSRVTPAPRGESIDAERERIEADTAAREAATTADTSAEGAALGAAIAQARGARIRIGGNLFVAEGEELNDAVAVLGSADINGILRGDLVVVGGNVRLGPKAIVHGDVVTVGGNVRGEAGAVIGGKITEMSLAPSDFRVWLPDDRQVQISFHPDWPRVARIAFVTGLMGTLFWFVVSALMITIAPGTIDRVRQRVGASPFKAFALGIAAEVVFLPALLIVTVILSVSIVGLPLLVLLPLVALAFFGAMAVGFTSVAYALGAFLVGRFSRVAALTLGLAMVWGTGLIGRYLWTTSHGAFGKGLALVIAGLAIEYLVCTLGLGAALLAWNASRRERRAAARSSNQTATVPPPLPIATAGDVQGS